MEILLFIILFSVATFVAAEGTGSWVTRPIPSVFVTTRRVKHPNRRNGRKSERRIAYKLYARFAVEGSDLLPAKSFLARQRRLAVREEISKRRRRTSSHLRRLIDAAILFDRSEDYLALVEQIKTKAASAWAADINAQATLRIESSRAQALRARELRRKQNKSFLSRERQLSQLKSFILNEDRRRRNREKLAAIAARKAEQSAIQDQKVLENKQKILLQQVNTILLMGCVMKNLQKEMAKAYFLAKVSELKDLPTQEIQNFLNKSFRSEGVKVAALRAAFTDKNWRAELSRRRAYRTL